MGPYTHVARHRRMVFDEIRNTAYARAMRQLVTPDCRVLDLGAGLGVHGLQAAKMGAKAFLVDASPVVVIGGEVARFNGLQDRVKVIHSSVERLELDESVDIIVSVFTGHFLVEEDLLPYLFNARDRFLGKGGSLIPGRGRLHVGLAQAESYYEDNISAWSQSTLGLDFSPGRRYAANSVYFSNAKGMQARMLSAAATLQEIDFSTATSADVEGRVNLEVETSGVCHGLVGWFDIQLGNSWLSTAPDAEPTHWSQMFLPLDPALELEKGEKLSVDINRPEFGDWTWSVKRGAETQRHSTFLNRIQDIGVLRKQSDSNVAGLGQEGRLALFVTQALVEQQSVAEIIAGVKKSFPALATQDPGLERRIRSLITRWGAE